MPRSVSTFLMFQGNAQQALSLYQSVFPSAKIQNLEDWGPADQGPEGTFKKADLHIAGHQLTLFESPAKHAFTFSPSISLFVVCETAEELDAAFARLSENGQVLMPVASYGFSQRFAWCNDPFGVSWQLNLP